MTPSSNFTFSTSTSNKSSSTRTKWKPGSDFTERWPLWFSVPSLRKTVSPTLSGFCKQSLNVVVVSGTVLAEMAFTIYLGEVPEDVVLVAVHLNGKSYGLPFATQSSHSITKVAYANNTQGYTLKVPFAHPMVEEKVKHHLGPLEPISVSSASSTL